MPISPDTLLQNRYRIVRQLGAGGMGAVYEAWDENLDCPVAVKQCFFLDDRMHQAFEHEAKLLARLSHPNLPTVSNHFIEGDDRFLVMRFIPGKDLSQVLAENGGPLPVERVLAWADRLLDALTYLHDRTPPVIHRDIKPANIKLTDRDELFLLDFGLAKGLPTNTSATAPASIRAYTPGYAPPEQMQGFGTDPRSDLYSLGATLYHLLTNTPPPDAVVRLVKLTGRTSGDPLPPASRINPAVPVALSNAIHQAMALDADDRPASAAEFRRSLKEAMAVFQNQETVVDVTDAATQPIKPPEAYRTVPAAGSSARTAPMPAGLNAGTTALSGTTEPLPPGRRANPFVLTAVGLLAVVAGFVTFQQLRPASPSSGLPTPVTPTTAVAAKPGATDFMFVPVQPGTFTMGGTAGNDNEKPPHQVTISRPFEIGMYEVTQIQWQAVMGNNPSHFTGCDTCPVEQVSWEDIQIFLKKLNDLDAKYTYRLPTEAEWEYVCRAGTTGDYAGPLPALAWYDANSDGKTHPVGTKKPNAWGVHDMHGNVWEWVADWYEADYYAKSPAADPTGPKSGTERVRRGGGWFFGDEICRSAIRGHDVPTARGLNVGFRLVRVAK